MFNSASDIGIPHELHSYFYRGLLPGLPRATVTEWMAALRTNPWQFDDAEAEAMPEMLWPVSWSEIAATLEQWVRAQQS